MNAPALTFSRITVRNCATSLEDGSSIPFTLQASESFPSLRLGREPRRRADTTWGALIPPATGGHLDVTLESSPIGEGRIGLAYSARVNAATDADGNDISGNMPIEVCLKIAKPMHCRSLAREAWFYEQLRESQGVATAKCHGFFTIPVTTEGSVRPWRESSEFPHIFPPIQVDYPSADWLPDDPPFRADQFAEDSFDVVQDSSWYKWAPKKDNLCLAILVLEKLGSHYYPEDEEPQADREALRYVRHFHGSRARILISHSESLRNVVDDVSFNGVWHTDVTIYNLLRAPPDVQAICSKHNTSHDWRLVDFDRSFAVDRYSTNSTIIDHMATEKYSIGEHSFWGSRGC